MRQEQRYQAQLKAFDHASAWGRLVATISAGVIALSATFLRDMPGSEGGGAVWCLFISLASLLVAVISGTIYVGTLAEYLFETSPGKLNIRDKQFMLHAKVEQFSFWIGIFLLIMAFIWLNLPNT